MEMISINDIEGFKIAKLKMELLDALGQHIQYMGEICKKITLVEKRT